MYNNEIFNNLDYQEIYERVSRMRKALERKYAPIELDTEQKTAKFKGSAAEPYITTLESCTCADWAINGRDIAKPCKHMYRLAHELHICNLNELLSNVGICDKKLQKEIIEILRFIDKYFEFMPTELLREKIDRLLQIKTL